MALDATSALTHATPLIPEGKKAPASGTEGEGAFGELLDTINPLQHIPVVSSAYREASGDEISPVAQILGGGIFGGIPGLIASAAGALFEAATGESAEEMAINALKEGVSSPSSEGIFAADSGTALTSDHGEAMVELAYTPPLPPAPEAPSSTSLRTVAGLSLERAAEKLPTLGLDNEGKRDQLKSGLDKVALEMMGNS